MCLNFTFLYGKINSLIFLFDFYGSRPFIRFVDLRSQLRRRLCLTVSLKSIVKQLKDMSICMWTFCFCLFFGSLRSGRINTFYKLLHTIASLKIHVQFVVIIISGFPSLLGMTESRPFSYLTQYRYVTLWWVVIFLRITKNLVVPTQSLLKTIYFLRY